MTKKKEPTQEENEIDVEMKRVDVIVNFITKYHPDKEHLLAQYTLLRKSFCDDYNALQYFLESLTNGK